jgi:hypothetical protein
MAGRAHGDQAVKVVAPRLAVVDGQPFPSPAGPAAAAVARERRLAVAGEAPPRRGRARVAAAADPCDGRRIAAGAEQRALGGGGQRIRILRRGLLVECALSQADLRTCGAMCCERKEAPAPSSINPSVTLVAPHGSRQVSRSFCQNARLPLTDLAARSK